MDVRQWLPKDRRGLYVVSYLNSDIIFISSSGVQCGIIAYYCIPVLRNEVLLQWCSDFIGVQFPCRLPLPFSQNAEHLHCFRCPPFYPATSFLSKLHYLNKAPVNSSFLHLLYMRCFASSSFLTVIPSWLLHIHFHLPSYSIRERNSLPQAILTRLR